jgi:hypothetical protein
MAASVVEMSHDRPLAFALRYLIRGPRWRGGASLINAAQFPRELSHSSSSNKLSCYFCHLTEENHSWDCHVGLSYYSFIMRSPARRRVLPIGTRNWATYKNGFIMILTL